MGYEKNCVVCFPKRERYRNHTFPDRASQVIVFRKVYALCVPKHREPWSGESIASLFPLVSNCTVPLVDSGKGVDILPESEKFGKLKIGNAH